MMKNADRDRAGELYAAHPRRFRHHRYVYPVLSRRAGGISIGVNLNLDKVCNFDCIYCQVNRTEPGEKEFVELARLGEELDGTVELVVSGQLFQDAAFAATPDPLRQLKDIALSGDGEPTTYRNFDEVVTLCADVRRRHRLEALKLVVITNASMFHRPRVALGLQILGENNGEIWAKLDAGSEAYYRQVARGVVPFPRILDNLRLAASQRPIVIQSLFMRIHGEPPPARELEAYVARLNEILAAGGQIHRVQVHTIARPPAERWVTGLAPREVDALAETIRQRTGLFVETFYGPTGNS